MERTLIIFKPDCISRRKIGATLARFEDLEFEVVACKMIALSPDVLRDHYAHIADKPFFPEIEGFMSSRPVIAAVLQGHGIIDRIRRIVGPTDSQEAPAGTIRGDWGTDKMLNIVHASDSAETARAEIQRFFNPEEIFEVPTK